MADDCTFTQVAALILLTQKSLKYLMSSSLKATNQPQANCTILIMQKLSEGAGCHLSEIVAVI